MNISSMMLNISVWVLFFPQLILDFSSGSAIQHIVEAAVPWFQVAVASITILKYGTELLDKKDKTDNSDDH